MSSIRSVCVFCGANAGASPAYSAAAAELGSTLAASSVRVVFGGGSVGLMGVLANAVLTNGGEITGVIPQALLDREIGHTGVTDMRVVRTMHERKAVMSELSDAFVALPGGLGTLEELFEVWTWAQLGIHAKPCALLNVDGYFDPLLAFLDRGVSEGFVRARHRAMLVVADETDELLARLVHTRPPAVARWLDRSQA